MSEPTRLPQQEDHVPWRPAVVLLLATLAVVAGSVVAPWAMLEHDRRLRPPAPPDPPVEPLAREPGDGGEPPTDQWRWIDRQRGIVALPIEEAMALVVERDGAER